MTTTRSSATPRPRGRPKIARPGEVAKEVRRQQVRNAQRSHRLRKAQNTRAANERCAILEAKNHQLEDVLSQIHHRFKEAHLHLIDPVLGFMLDDAALRIAGEESPVAPSQPAPTEAHESQELLGEPQSLNGKGNEVFGYSFFTHVPSPELEKSRQTLTLPCESHDSNRLSRHSTGPRSPNCLLSLLTMDPVTSYSFQEISFSRRLQRACLEHAFHLFDNPNADPRAVYRMFRLVPCIRNKDIMRPIFHNLVQRGAGEPLELTGLPFYCIGDAGKHYPRVDTSGECTFPSKMRLPKRILGIRPGQYESTNPDGTAYQEFLGQMGYGGQWFDSHEVACYLKERGIDPDATTDDRATFSLVELEAEDMPSNESSEIRANALLVKKSFDLQRFLEFLTCRVVLLGRAPGFAQATVDAAINLAKRTAT